MTPKQRMLAAYRGVPADTVPVAPEFWYYIPARVLGTDMVTFEREVPLWQGLWRSFTHYRCEGWGIVSPRVTHPDVRTEEKWVELGEGRFESRRSIGTPFGALATRTQYHRDDPSWAVEREIKDFSRDWPAYRAATLGVVEQADWSDVERAIAAVGDDCLLEVSLGLPFLDYIAHGREGGLAQAIFDLLEHRKELQELHEVYLDYMRRLTRAAVVRAQVEVVFVGCSWSCVSLVGPSLWRTWDKPVIEAVAQEAHAAGKLLHIHFHGRCMDVLPDLLECGADCICPFERPPGGDVTDLGEVRRILADRVTVNGNIHTVETLIRGTPADVRREVEGIFSQWGPDVRRLILGTGDQVGRETPDENLYAMIEAGRRWGRLTQ
jgi:uroporphyrinogen decarboxylase